MFQLIPPKARTRPKRQLFCTPRCGRIASFYLALAALIILACIPARAQGRVVRVGVYQNEPKIFMDANGRASGFHIQILEQIAAEEGWTLEYAPGTWAECLAALEAGQIDLMPDVAYSIERDARYDFHRIPVAESWSQVYASPGAEINEFRDLAGRRVAVLGGSIQQTVFKNTMRGFGYEAEITPVASLEEAFRLASNGAADAAIASHFFGNYFYRDYGLVKTPIVFNVVTLHFATAQGRNADLLQAIDRHLADWTAEPDSIYYTILNRWTNKTPPYQMPRYLYWAIGGAVGLLLLAGAMILLLRGQVRARTQHLERANEALRKSELRYQLISTVASDYMFSTRVMTDGSLAHDWVAGAFATNTAYTIPEYNAHGRWRAALHPDDLAVDDRDLTRLRANQPVISEIRTVTKSGKIVWVRVYAHPVWDAERNRLVGIYGAVQDITERKRDEAELRRYAEEMTTLNALGRRVSQTLSVEQVVADAVSEMNSAVRSDLAFLFLRDGERLVLQGIVPQEAEAEFDGLAEHRLGECLCGAAAREGKTLYARDIFTDPRCTREECRQAGYRSFAALPLRGGDEIIGVIGLAAKEERDFQEEATYLETLASQVAIGLHNALLHRRVQQHADELEQRVAERTAQLYAANKELESFSYSVSHDLRAPLRAISGFASIVSRRHRAALNEEGQHYIDNVVQASERMGQLIDDLLQYSRLGRQGARHDPIALRDVLAPLASDLAGRLQEIGGALTIADNLPTVLGDRTLLGQIFTNLLENAVTYRKADMPAQIAVSWQPDGADALIRVRDDGIGIPAEYHEKIFAVFQRLHSEDEYPGTGIGLATVKKSVELLGGKVWVESVVGEGSTFCVKLPMAQEHIG